MAASAVTPAARRRARRWFWVLTATAVLAMGALHQALRSAPGPGTGMLVLAGALVLVLSVVQAARILAALAGPQRRCGRLPSVARTRRTRHARHRPRPSDPSGPS
jgi:hypothetical protein